MLLYENDFTSSRSIYDWSMEGPGEILWQPGKMILVPIAQPALYKAWQKHGRNTLDAWAEYYPIIEKKLVIDKYDGIEKLKVDGEFCGGHIVCWNKVFETEDSYLLEYDFKPLSPIGLGIIFFSARGENGEDVFSENLKPRHGVFGSYINSDIDCYHISYRANSAAVGKRGTCNLRKNAGFYLLASGNDPTSADLDYSDQEFEFNTYKIMLLKRGNRIKFYIDGCLTIDYEDNRFNDVLIKDGSVSKKGVDTGQALKGGRIALRQMTGLAAEYSNFKVYKIVGNCN